MENEHHHNLVPQNIKYYIFFSLIVIIINVFIIITLVNLQNNVSLITRSLSSLEAQNYMLSESVSILGLELSKVKPANIIKPECKLIEQKLQNLKKSILIIKNLDSKIDRGDAIIDDIAYLKEQLIFKDDIIINNLKELGRLYNPDVNSLNKLIEEFKNINNILQNPTSTVEHKTITDKIKHFIRNHIINIENRQKDLNNDNKFIILANILQKLEHLDVEGSVEQIRLLGEGINIFADWLNNSEDYMNVKTIINQLDDYLHSPQFLENFL